MDINRNRLLHCCITAICLLPVFILTSFEATVCSWDYSIWIPRHKHADPLYRFIRDGKAGYIDRSGNVVIEPKFEFHGNSGNDFRDGLMEIGISEGLAPVRVGSKWGYIDKKGRMAIKPQFDNAYPFSDGFALVEQGRMSGYIDHSGAIMIALQYQHAGHFSDGLAVVGVGNENDRSNKEYFYINKQGEQAISEKFALASGFFKGLAHVKIKTDTEKDIKDSDANGSYAYIDVTGKKIFSY